MVCLLAEKLAQFHQIRAPIPSDGSAKWLDIQINDYFRDGSLFDSIKTDRFRDLIRQSTGQYLSLSQVDISDELIWLRDAVLGSPKILVFSHCDFNRGNILIRESIDTSIDMYFIDFDFCSYNYRGIDFGRYFSSWKHRDPKFGCDPRFPSDEEMYPFIDKYIQVADRLTGNTV
ncbi:choline/ethanolamine kinase-like [Oppia nitens]|uniref:choline/ethanolamine kinase-like n=1 Tax=Oppia nitens TaxID=1686743 RepID=UPI0023D9BFBE|nr:choline/ethanolamine kinase-like [Oppia nitens]